MNNYFKRFSSLILMIVLAGGIFGAGFWYGKNSIPSVEKISGVLNPLEGQPAGADFSLFWDAWKEVQEKFVNRNNLDPQKMVYGAISGMLSALDDPYTVFMTPKENEEFSESMQGNFQGIGAEIGLRKGLITVISPLENSPAKAAGLMPGDMILKIDEKSTEGLLVEEAVSLIRGEKGTEVKLTIARSSLVSSKEIKIIRDVINIPIVTLETKEINGKKIAYVSLSQFTENSVSEFKKTSQKISASDFDGMILDLRNNPGGYLESSVEIAGQFLEKGKLVVSEDYGDGKKKEHFSEGGQQLSSLPLVVLINGGSASASEILAGALRDQLGTRLAGEKSFGKGSVQELEQMKNGTSLKITVAKWLTPSGHSIMDDGLEPDEKVSFNQEDIDEGRDPQLDKALEMLK
ncbi:MAG: Carboxyl-terminal protease [Parcubacteria group bacterium GW2011_GWA1_42_7]|nr:MAG: Carboxyl-terminal protease [Parcubacteria group bacterium GW2011_GWA1_42_7]KKS91895.1 MAG: Carboxyl-terminal protease [Parcubacteria group bacterium GW2011_GWC1_43_12]